MWKGASNILGDQNGRHGSQEDGVAAQESQEFGRRREDFPLSSEVSKKALITHVVLLSLIGDRRLTHRNESPAADDGSEQLAAADVDVFGAERHQVVGRADRVGRDVDAERDDDQADRGEGGGRAPAVRARVQPHADDVDGIPHDLAVRGLGRGGGEDAEKTDDRCRTG